MSDLNIPRLLMFEEVRSGAMRAHPGLTHYYNQESDELLCRSRRARGVVMRFALVGPDTQWCFACRQAMGDLMDTLRDDAPTLGGDRADS